MAAHTDDAAGDGDQQCDSEDHGTRTRLIAEQIQPSLAEFTPR